ncbi:MAG: hypothetical protein ABI442_12720 [Gemmatimonadaceae bacterium]
MTYVTPSFDFSVPFDIMIGAWAGTTTSYSEDGTYRSTVPSQVFIYWKVPGEVMHFEQEELPDLDALLDKDHPHRAAFKKIISSDFDLRITGKSCVSEKNADDVIVNGAETMPGTYLFHLHFMKFGHFYNNQYFVSPNERHIVGPYLPNNSHDIGLLVSQTWVRLSYSVNPKRVPKSGADKKAR